MTKKFNQYIVGQKTKTVFLAIAFGTSVRDVLRNDSFQLLRRQKNIRIVIFANDINENFRTEFGGENIFFEQLIQIKPIFIERILYHFMRALMRDRCRTIDLGNTSGETKTIDKFTPFARYCLKVFGHKKMNSIIYWLFRNLAAGKEYRTEFKYYKPDLVIVTRVLGYSADYPIMRRAEVEKVPVISLVSSWDNLTSKAFFPFSLKALIVWNEVLAQEAVELFDFPREKIYITGIPRYDIFFRKTEFRIKEEYFKSKGLDIKKNLITYCTGSSATGQTSIDPTTPEPKIASFIADQIENGIILNAQLIVRLHPQADISHYKNLNDRKGVFVQIPGNKSNFQDRLFSEKDDVEFGENMLYSDVVVNLASTVTIDAVVFNTPVICINFDFYGERPFKHSIKRFYEFDHYAKLLQNGGVKLAESKEELIDNINEYLSNPQLDSDGRKRIVNQQCVFTDGKSGERVAQLIISTLQQL